MSRRVIYRFRRDLRLEDHLGLVRALSEGRVVPVLLLDDLTVARVSANARRATFYCQAVAALEQALRARGAQLVVRRARRAGPALVALARALDAAAVAWSWTYDGPGLADDRDTAQALEEAGVRVLLAHDAPVLSPEDVDLQRHGAGEGYRAFTPYRAAWSRVAPVEYASERLLDGAFDVPAAAGQPLPEPRDFGHEPVTLECAGGAAAAAERLATFLDLHARDYTLARRLFAGPPTSHLGADLALGTLSARRIVRELRALAGRPYAVAEERRSFEEAERALVLRDFFLQLSWHWPRTHERPLQEKPTLAFAGDAPGVAAWEHGMTGYPLVDAAMRELRARGWMHPKARAVAASFLCFDLGVSWKRGREIFDRYLVEDDAALATGNWQWIAGVGADMAQYPRIYNPVRQARTFDPEGRYVRRWVPELAGVPAHVIHAPLDVSPRGQMELPFIETAHYPRPIVEHDAAARKLLARYRALPRRST
ncbi:deoxyribodipyrimidine photo-lyase [bacterium]|nr:MAG: deoxyribodipyrimidine photo-lyase [bacterium]